MGKWVKMSARVVILMAALVLMIPIMTLAKSNDVTVAVNGVNVGTEADAYTDNGKTYVNVAAFADVTGVSYTYDKATNKVTVNGTTMDVQSVDGKAFAYVRDIAKAAGAIDLKWDGKTQTVNITYGKQLIVYGDVVTQAGCAPENRFKAGDAIIFRMKAVNPITGAIAEDAKLQVHLSTGDVLDMHYGAHPPDAPNAEYFWTVRYDVTEDTPKGILNYKVTAETSTMKGEFKPFNVMPSLLTIISAEGSDQTGAEQPAAE